MSTYTPIASITLASATSSVTFSGIPQTYTDLVLVGNGTNTTSAVNLRLQMNSDTGSNYSDTRIYGDGSSAASDRLTNQTAMPIGISNSVPTSHILNFQNYSNTTTNKTVIARTGSAGGYVDSYVGLWRSTSAISSIVLFPESNNFSSGFTFNLYGIANASITNVAKATGGDSVYTDGTYWYHIFRSSGTFTPTQALTADYLVVAGGGAGSDYGGGGAGGLRSTVTATGGGGSLESPMSLTIDTNYTITVGAGGTGGAIGTNGSDSSISGTGITTITSTGGGRGANNVSPTQNNGSSGGSGGGGKWINTSTFGTGGAGTANQGYAGGNGYQSNGNDQFPSGGGGGAGAVGGNATGTGVSGNGGNGVAVSITGSSVTYAGGGGGGLFHSSNSVQTTGGTGGGGTGGNDGIGTTAGTVNLGGGGGGAGNTNDAGGSGGSGIVIVRYPV